MDFFLTERFYHLKRILHVNMRPQTPKGEVSFGSVHILVISDSLDCLRHSILKYELVVLSQGKPTGKDFEGSEWVVDMAVRCYLRRVD